MSFTKSQLGGSIGLGRKDPKFEAEKEFKKNLEIKGLLSANESAAEMIAKNNELIKEIKGR